MDTKKFPQKKNIYRYETSHHDKSIGTKRLTMRYETFRPRSKQPGKNRQAYETTRILQFIMGKSPQRHSDVII